MHRRRILTTAPTDPDSPSSATSESRGEGAVGSTLTVERVRCRPLHPSRDGPPPERPRHRDRVGRALEHIRRVHELESEGSVHWDLGAWPSSELVPQVEVEPDGAVPPRYACLPVLDADPRDESAEPTDTHSWACRADGQHLELDPAVALAVERALVSSRYGTGDSRVRATSPVLRARRPSQPSRRPHGERAGFESCLASARLLQVAQRRPAVRGLRCSLWREGVRSPR